MPDKGPGSKGGGKKPKAGKKGVVIDNSVATKKK